jgi:aspartate/methionine/tyrosine aminotransferase
LLESNDWLPDMQWLDQLDTSRIKLMFLNYPHMPTGKVADETTLAQLVALAKRKDILLVHDNPYSFILNDNPYSLFKVPGAKAVALELNSLSKSHNMAGWRLGVLIGAAERIIEVLRFKSNMDSGMFLPLQLAAVKALGLGEQWYTKLNDIYRLRREKVHAILDTLGCPYLPGQSGLFVWAHIPEHYENAYVFSDEVLQRYHIFITPGAIFGNEGLHYVRVSLCADISILEETLKRLPGFKT